MEFLTENGERYILISSQLQLEEVVAKIEKKVEFCHLFKFSERDLFVSLLKSLNIPFEHFFFKYYYYDSPRKLHIGESEFGCIWISTIGLVARKKPSTNRMFNSCLTQYTVISLLLNKAIEVVKDENVYDIDSYNFGALTDLSPAIFHNITFYIEVFCKTYLSLTGINAPRSHKLQAIYKLTVDSMISNNHDDSFFRIAILDPLYKVVDHVGKIPGGFKEQFIKYDDNPYDDTVIVFDLASLNEMATLIEISVDFISDFFERGADTRYLEPNVYQRMLDTADTNEKKSRIKALYSNLKKE